MEIFRMDHRPRRAGQRITGRSAAPGIARGPLLRLAATTPQRPSSRSAGEEQQALADALQAARLDLAALGGKVKDEESEAILAFQIAFLEDENLAAPAFAGIADGKS